MPLGNLSGGQKTRIALSKILLSDTNLLIPCLFIHGDADTFVPCEMGMKNYTACKAPKDLLVVPEAEHGMSFVVAPDVYKKKVLDFFAAYDPPAPPKRRKCLFGNRKGTVS